jgi:hypothetical protein
MSTPKPNKKHDDEVDDWEECEVNNKNEIPEKKDQK